MGETEPPAGAADRRDNPGLSQFEKYLFQKNRGNIFFFGKRINGNRDPVFAKFGQRKGGPQRVTAPGGNPHGGAPPFCNFDYNNNNFFKKRKGAFFRP
jgi:hypothetical protein